MNRDVRIAGLACAAIGLYDVVDWCVVLSGGPPIGPRSDVLFPDYLVFHAAARAFVEAKLAIVYDIEALTRYQVALFPDWFGSAVEFRPFFYPPTWLLMLVPFALMPIRWAYATFIATTAAAATLAEGRRDPWGWLAALTSPAALWVALAGQNTFLSVALFYGGMRLLDRSPAAAGILLGLLTYKPQLWILIPVALLAARQWRAFFWMISAATVTCLVSLGVFGVDFWRAFVASTGEASAAPVADGMFVHFQTQMVTLFSAARLAGFSPGSASMIQLVGALLAAALTAFAHWRHGPSEARLAVLIAATFMMSPYAMNYDLLLLMPVVVTLFRQGAAEGFYPAERLVLAVVWVIPTLGVFLNTNGVPVMPFVVLLFGAMAWKRLDGRARTA
jgi:alpha-1,2-mannosyltransferase